MDAEGINGWFSEHIHDHTVVIEDLGSERLLELRRSAIRMERILQDFAASRQGAASDRFVSVVGYGVAVIGPVTFLTPLAFLSIPITVAGTVIAALQMFRERQRAIDMEWCEARTADLKKFSDRVERELLNRIVDV